MAGLKQFTGTSGFKAAMLGMVILLLLIPVAMIRNIIRERAVLAEGAEEEIMRAWGDEFLILGPVLQIPLVEYEEIKTKNDKGEEKIEVWQHTALYRFAPEQLSADVVLKTEIKKRGIFSVPLYGGQIHLSGTFATEKIGAGLEPNQKLFPERAELVIALSGQRGIRGVSSAEWNGGNFEFLSGSQGFSLRSYGQGGIHSPVNIAAGKANTFDIRMDIQGGKSLRMIPLGGDTDLFIKADWNAPSFKGAYLPIEKSIDEKGFEARWQISHLSRNIPSSWIEMDGIVSELAEARFGVDFFKVLDHYDLNTRAVKYALLFLIVPFLSLFLIENILRKKDRQGAEGLAPMGIHPVQYLLAGIGNVVFYLLLLAFSEHISFHAAYWIAAPAVIIMTGLYSRTLLGAWSRSLLMAMIMLLCYAFLYFTLQSEDWALLIGALGCFVIIAAVMFFTRRLNWYGAKEDTATEMS
ncbi:cell envelope integrity protein CreD [Spirochaetia bacterium]|nr:cell envelope integrity protein CreD [Spirochaetia bacterium]